MAQSIVCTQYENCCNLVSHIFRKNLVKVTFLLKKLLNSWFDEMFVFRWEQISVISTVCTTLWRARRWFFKQCCKTWRQLTFVLSLWHDYTSYKTNKKQKRTHLKMIFSWNQLLYDSLYCKRWFNGIFTPSTSANSHNFFNETKLRSTQKSALAISRKIPWK